MKYKKHILGIILSLIVLPLVSAFGVTAPYWEDRPLIMYPGQTQDMALLLQNMVGEDDVILEASIAEGSEIAVITDSDATYTVPFGSKDIEVNLMITIPEDTPLDTEYTVLVSFKQVSADEGKMVQMTTGIEKPIPIIVRPESESTPVVEEVEPEEGMSTAMIIGLIVLVIILYLILTGKSSKKGKK